LTVERLESRALFAGLINIDMPIAPTLVPIPAAIVSTVDTTVGEESNTAASDEVPSYLNEHSINEVQMQDQNDSGAVTGENDDDRSETDETDADGSTVKSPVKDLIANETDNGGSSGIASPLVTSQSPQSVPVYSTPPLLSRTDSPAASVAPIVVPNPESHFRYFQSVTDQPIHPTHPESAISDEKLARLMVRDSFVASMTLNKMDDEDHITKTRSKTVLTTDSESASEQAIESHASREVVAETERQELLDLAISSMEFANEIVQIANLASAAPIDTDRSPEVIEDITNVESPNALALTASRSEPRLRLRTSRFELLSVVSMLLPVSMAIKKRQVDRTLAVTVRPQSHLGVRSSGSASDDNRPGTSEPTVECHDAWFEPGLTEATLRKS